MTNINMATENRRYTPTEVGALVRQLRDGLAWKQVTLAAAAHVDERTIQRVEAGEAVNDATLQKIAAALRLDPSHFTAKHVIKSPEQLQKEIETYTSNYTAVPIARARTGRDLMDSVAGSDATYFEVLGEAADEVHGNAASIFDYVRDLVDVWSDISFSDRETYFGELTDQMRNLERLGFVVCVGCRKVTLKSSALISEKAPLPFTLSYVVVIAQESPLKALIVPRQGSIGF